MVIRSDDRTISSGFIRVTEGQQVMADWGAVAGTIGAIGGFAGAGLSAWALRKSREANQIAKEANEISRKSLDVAERTYQTQYVPDIVIQWGRNNRNDVEPNIRLLQVDIRNRGQSKVVIEKVSVFFESSPYVFFGFPPASAPEDVVPNPKLPHELIPGHSASIATDLDWVLSTVEGCAPSATASMAFRVLDQTGMTYDSIPIPVGEFLFEMRKPIWPKSVVIRAMQALEEESPGENE